MSHALDATVAAFVADAHARAPGVQRWFEQAGLAPADVQSVADLSKVPVLSKDHLVELQATDPPFGGFLAVPMAGVQRIFMSPGPLYEPHGDETAWQDMGAALLRRAGLSQGDIVLNALGYHFAPGGFLLDGIVRALGATVVPVGVGNAELQVKILVDLGVTCYAGTPSWLMTLLQKADELKLRDAIRLRTAFLSAEPLAPGVRQQLVDRYGMAVVNAYATAELGVLAYDIEGAPTLRLVEHPIVQVVDRDTGQEVGPGDVGEIVVTNLSATYPLIRFGTGDLAMNLDPAPGKSSQGERSIRLVGRIGEAVKVRGMFVHPNQIRVVAGQLGVDACMAIVRRPETRDELTLRIVLPPGASQSELEPALATAFRAICRVALDRLEVVAALDAQPGTIVDERTWE